MSNENKVYIPNSFQTPNVLIDEVMAVVSGAAFKVLMAINRHTLGWNHDGVIQVGGRQLGSLKNGVVEMGMTALKEVTGLSHQAIIEAGVELKDLDLIVIRKSPRNSRIPNGYSLNLNLTTGELVRKIDQSKKLSSPTSQKSRLVPVRKVDSLKTNTANTYKSGVSKRHSRKHPSFKDPRVQSLLTSFIRKYLNKVGLSYVVVDGKDPALLKRLLSAGHDIEAIETAMDRYFADLYYNKIGFHVGGFVSAYNRLSSAGSKKKHDYEKDAFPSL